MLKVQLSTLLSLLHCKHSITTQTQNLVFECSSIELSDLNSIVISIYTIPDQRIKDIYLNKLDKLLSILKKGLKTKSVVVAGDFNINILQIGKTSKN